MWLSGIIGNFKRKTAGFSNEGESYRKMNEASPARRVGIADEIAAAGAFLLGKEAGFIPALTC